MYTGQHKIKVKKREMAAVYGARMVQIGYCGAQFLLRYRDPFAYNSGVNGWNCDYYMVDNVVICTGYQPHGVNANDVTNTYNKKAEAIFDDYNYSYEERREELNAILHEWTNELKKLIHGGNN